MRETSKFPHPEAPVLLRGSKGLLLQIYHSQYFPRLFRFALTVPHLCVETLLAQQCCMRTALGNQAFVENDDFISVDNS